ncbi:MAG: 30S ribosomal protein S17 [Acidobacteria bacterium]|nr:30S ribosomal protein S17 [Acidobacteriota bacterium]
MANKNTEEIEDAVEPTEETAAVEEPAAENAAEASAETTETAEAAPIEAPAESIAAEPKAPAGDDTAKVERVHKRAEKIGVVSSDKMTKTVVVRVDRLVKHPIYRKYIRKRKKFMAHDDFGARIGDKVRIVETRPLSARKRWRVVEIIQKAEI